MMEFKEALEKEARRKLFGPANPQAVSHNDLLIDFFKSGAEWAYTYLSGELLKKQRENCHEAYMTVASTGLDEEEAILNAPEPQGKAEMAYSIFNNKYIPRSVEEDDVTSDKTGSPSVVSHNSSFGNSLEQGVEKYCRHCGREYCKSDYEEQLCSMCDR
jgi:hypothetical protein